MEARPLRVTDPRRRVVHRVPVEDARGQRAAYVPQPEAVLVLAPLGERAPRKLAAVQLAVLGHDGARALVGSAHDQPLAGGAATHRARLFPAATYKSPK